MRGLDLDSDIARRACREMIEGFAIERIAIWLYFRRTGKTE